MTNSYTPPPPPPLNPLRMGRKKTKKPKPTHEEVLDRQAHAAWKYRQRNREAINRKARERMRRPLKSAPSAVQLEHRLRAEQHRKNYLEGSKQSVKKPLPRIPTKNTVVSTALTPPRVAKSVLVKKAPVEVKEAPPKRTVMCPALSLKIKPGPAGQCLFDVGPPPPHLWLNPPRAPDSPTPIRPRRAPDSPTPMSLTQIDAGEDSEDISDDGSGDGWDGDTETERPGLNWRRRLFV
ncbi:hypothetical protein DFH06DRAFT_1129607 [Mycena polygramma]|nr:hypothetical protein DFH06DRAFT_1129607 [Mycena polygramma]